MFQLIETRFRMTVQYGALVGLYLLLIACNPSVSSTMVKVAEDFPKVYEAALATQDWRQVEPLIHRDASVTFSNGSVHRGKDAVEQAFTRNFSLIQSEEYGMSNIHWMLRTDDTAVYLFDFEWTGIIHGEQVSGNGRGTAVIVRDSEWRLLVEHLGPGEASR